MDGEAPFTDGWRHARTAASDEIDRVVRFLVSCGVGEDVLRVVSAPGGDDSSSSRSRRASPQLSLLARRDVAGRVADLLRPFGWHDADQE